MCRRDTEGSLQTEHQHADCVVTKSTSDQPGWFPRRRATTLASYVAQKCGVATLVGQTILHLDQVPIASIQYHPTLPVVGMHLVSTIFMNSNHCQRHAKHLAGSGGDVATPT